MPTSESAPVKTVTVNLRMPSEVLDFCKFMAEINKLDLETYLMQGIKDLIIGELHYLVVQTKQPESEDDSDARVCFRRYLSAHTGENSPKLTTAHEAAAKLGFVRFLKPPYHSATWDLDLYDGERWTRQTR